MKISLYLPNMVIFANSEDLIEVLKKIFEFFGNENGGIGEKIMLLSS